MNWNGKLGLMVQALLWSALWIGCHSESNEDAINITPDRQAYVGVHVVDVASPEMGVLEHMTIVVKDGIILEIGSADQVKIDAYAEVIDVQGKWAIPGLIDMHAHATVLPVDSQLVVIEKYDEAASFEALKTLLAFGVTTIRNPAAPTLDAVKLKTLVEHDSIVGPTIYTTGFALNRTKAFFGPFVAPATEEEIREEVRHQIQAGVDFIKVYASLKPAQISIAIDEAHKQDKKVIGHLQNTSWTEASALGIDFITHAAPWHKTYLPTAIQPSYKPTFLGRLTWLEQVNYADQPIQEMLASMVEHQVSVDPTLIAFHTKFWGDDEYYTATENLKLAPDLVTSIWKQTTFTDHWSQDDFARAKEQWNKLTQLTKLMHDNGILITAGSDFPNPWVIPGLSVHQEMQLMVDAGIAPIEVIKIASLNGAIALDIAQQTGSISVGKEADILFLNSNPLENIEHSQDILFILNNGNQYFPTELNKHMTNFLEKN